MSTNHPPFENGQQYPTYERDENGMLTLLGKQQHLQAHIDGECAGCGSALHDRYPAAPTAWQSIPSPIRFAAWVWAISVIISVFGAVVFAITFILGIAAGLGSL